MKPITQFLVAASLISLAACTKPGTEGVSTDPGKLQPGFVKGHVVDTQGRPIKGATIIANSANHYNDNNMAITDANGNYKIGLPNGPAVGAFYVRGSVKMSMEKRTSFRFSPKRTVRSCPMKALLKTFSSSCPVRRPVILVMLVCTVAP